MTVAARFSRRSGLLAAALPTLGLATLARPRPARADGSFAAVRARGQLRLGLHIDDTPMAFADRDGRLDGLAVALGEALATGMGVRPDIYPTFHGEQVSDLLDGRFDLLLTAPPLSVEAARVMMFSHPYAAMEWHLLAPRDTVLGGLEGLEGMRLAQITGWSAVFANRLLGRGAERARLYADWQAIAAALTGGHVDAAAVPASMASRLIAEVAGLERKLRLGQAWMTTSMSFGHHDLLAVVNAQLMLLHQRGALAILHRHFLGTALPRPMVNR